MMNSFLNSQKFYKLLLTLLVMVLTMPAMAQLQRMNLLNSPVDISGDFRCFKNTYFFADSVVDFNPKTASGEIVYRRHNFQTRKAFNNMLGALIPSGPNEFPATEYEASPTLPFSIEFISPRTIRLRANSGFVVPRVAAEPSLMLVNNEMPPCKSWRYSTSGNQHIYTSPYARLVITESPFRIEVYDGTGKLLTSTNHATDNVTTWTPVMPFSYVRRASDYSRSFNAAFNLQPGEKIFGLGEKFTEFDKRGQKVVLWVDDPHGTQNETSYKPIPFFMSSRGYGKFMHTSTPITLDIGKYFNSVNSIMIGDEDLDIFIFVGEPKDVLNEYTNVTGKPQMPPLWSFGFWMSRITYFSEAEGREAARLLRYHKIPADVINFDTGWFEVDWRNDFKFAPSRFENPEQMIADFKADGFRICLWQLPYFTPRNTLFNEIIDQGLFVRNAKGGVPYEDAKLDFTNPAAIEWYRGKLTGLLRMGVGVIKVDFGEAAPPNGIFHNDRTGFYEHNLYPLRYNKIVADLTREITGENIIWARSAWAGSQRFPLHWGGDAEPTNGGMKATLRGGLSLGLSGFTFWSHDAGGFIQKTPEDVYRRWLAFSALSSHTRAHGHPPKEPWLYSPEFLNYFRDVINMRYRLMPYIYAQSKHAIKNGLPMMRALFVEFPNDPGAWLVDDQYLFGSDMMVAPLFEDVNSRDVYLPGTQRWIDYQTGKVYNPGWHQITAGNVEAIILVRDGAVIPHIALAQTTKDMDWSNIELRVFSSDATRGIAKVCLPTDNILHEVSLVRRGGRFAIENNPLAGKTRFNITMARSSR